MGWALRETSLTSRASREACDAVSPTVRQAGSYSTLSPASRTTGHHFSISDF